MKIKAIIVFNQQTTIIERDGIGFTAISAVFDERDNLIEQNSPVIAFGNPIDVGG